MIRFYEGYKEDKLSCDIHRQVKDVYGDDDMDEITCGGWYRNA